MHQMNAMAGDTHAQCTRRLILKQPRTLSEEKRDRHKSLSLAPLHFEHFINTVSLWLCELADELLTSTTCC